MMVSPFRSQRCRRNEKMSGPGRDPPKNMDSAALKQPLRGTSVLRGEPDPNQTLKSRHWDSTPAPSFVLSFVRATAPLSRIRDGQRGQGQNGGLNRPAVFRLPIWANGRSRAIIHTTVALEARALNGRKLISNPHQRRHLLTHPCPFVAAHDEVPDQRSRCRRTYPRRGLQPPPIQSTSCSRPRTRWRPCARGGMAFISFQTAAITATGPA